MISFVGITELSGQSEIEEQISNKGTEIADIYKHLQISEEEISFLTRGEDPFDDAVVRKLFHPNLKLLLVTEGPGGCRYYTKVSIPYIVLMCCIQRTTYTEKHLKTKKLVTIALLW